MRRDDTANFHLPLGSRSGHVSEAGVIEQCFESPRIEASRPIERSRCRFFTFNGYFGFSTDSQKIYDLYPHGGFCEFMTAPQYALVVKLPDNVGFEQAARFGYLGTSYGAMKKAGAAPGQSMLVDGTRSSTMVDSRARSAAAGRR